ncbi:MAG: pilus assembly protein N-terminal domain-containing protein [Deltaproteobacteria bacterium]|nr:pilus assembly protein N-terminal domain-containing protein [Deltaproteobacteria bacterium]
MKKALLSLIFSLMIISNLYSTEDSLPPGSTNIIVLSVGQSRTFSIPGATKVVEGDSSVASVSAVGNQIIVRGMGPGETNMVVFKGNKQIEYIIKVTPSSQKATIADVKRLLGDREGIKVNQVGELVIIEGNAITTEDYDRVVQLTKLYGNVTNNVKLNPNAKRLSANALVETLKRNGIKDVNANVVGNIAYLEGSVESAEDMKKMDIIIRAVGEQVENLVTIGIKRMVLLEVQFVEIKRGSFDKIGIKYPTDISGNLQGTIRYDDVNVIKGSGESSRTITTSGIATASSDFAFGFQFNDGYSRVLAQPKLISASGEKASFLSGGQIPIPLITRDSASVEYKDFGVKLEITPNADSLGNIQTSIDAEISDVDRSLSIMLPNSGVSIPGFKTRRISTKVTVKHGETIILSGLFHNDESKDVSKLPLLGHIPILGELFKSRNFQEKKTDLAIFVTPRIVSPNTPRVKEMIDDIKARYKKAKGEVKFNIFD